MMIFSMQNKILKMRTYQRSLRLLLVALLICVGTVLAQHEGPPIPQAKIDELGTALTADKDESSEARKRLSVKRMIRDGSELLEANVSAPNRFEILGLLFKAQQQLFGMDDSSRNREALLEICRELVKAPDLYADLRLDADLLLTQTELAREGGGKEARLAALKPMVARYRNTPSESKMLRVAMVMALELGDPRLIQSLRDQISERFAGDLEMINFQRDKLGGQVFGAPFCGIFKRSDGGMMQLPGDALGKTTVLYFWSKKDPAVDHVERLAAEWKAQKNEIGNRLNIVSFNVDELPDAGEKILSDLGVDWPALHLPGGRESPLYKTFPQNDPAMMTLTPTGYAALVMSGSTRVREGDTGKTDFARWFQSSLARDWSRARYTTRLTSLFAGDFLVVDPEGPFDPMLPPEIKAGIPVSPRNSGGQQRDVSLVPVDTLNEIQKCFVKAPLRYRMSAEEIRSSYQRAEDLCAKAIAAYPTAPDLWIVRNRRIVARLGLWKLTSDHAHYQRAVAEAKAALDAGTPKGVDVVARFCLAKEALHDPEAISKKVISDFVETMGGEHASGPALAAAALLALDVADRGLHEEYRNLILARHVDHPMMWTFVSFLLDRYHRYWLFRVPFTAGWSYERQQQWVLSQGQPDEVQRSVRAELQTLDGKPYRIPEDSSGKWTVVLFGSNCEDPKKSPLHEMAARHLMPYVDNRGLDDVQLIVAVMADDLAPVSAYLKDKPNDCETLVVPAGVANPLVQQLGILDEDETPNALVLRPDGSIAAALSGLTMSRVKGPVIPNVIDWHDEQAVKALLESGELEKAGELIFKLAPPYDPEAVDEKGRKLKEPVFSIFHLRARARVYMVLKKYEAALADAEAVVKSLTATGGSMSMRPKDLDDAEQFLEAIHKNLNEAK